MADSFQEQLFERLNRIEDEQRQQGKDIAAMKQHLANNIEQKKTGWAQKVTYVGWFFTLVGLAIAIVAAVK